MEITGQLIKEVWSKGTLIQGQDPESIRMDIYGVWIKLKDYNNVDSTHGWTIYQAKPMGEEGFKNPENLIPIHTHNNPIPLAGFNPSKDELLHEPII